MSWEDDEPVFEIVDEPRERTCYQDNPKFEIYEDEEPGELDADEVDALGLDPTGRDGNPRFPFTETNLTDVEREALTAYRNR